MSAGLSDFHLGATSFDLIPDSINKILHLYRHTHLQIHNGGWMVIDALITLFINFSFFFTVTDFTLRAGISIGLYTMYTYVYTIAVKNINYAKRRSFYLISTHLHQFHKLNSCDIGRFMSKELVGDKFFHCPI